MSSPFKWVDMSRIHPDNLPEAMARLEQYYPAQHALVTDPVVQQAVDMFAGRLLVQIPVQQIRQSQQGK